MQNPTKIIFNFSKESKLSSWKIVNDVVMGGRSTSKFSLNEEGYAEFSGNVSTENYGGFASVRYFFPSTNIQGYTKVRIRLKGDGKDYQFRLKSNIEDYFSFISTFPTSGEWETIEINLNDLYPSYRGRKLEQANFNDDHIEEIRFLIANKRNESFKLIIDKIQLE
jgi:hypothetical protein